MRSKSRTRPSSPTLLRILLVAVFAAWVALATALGWSSRTVWKGTGVGLAVAALVQWLWRGRSSPTCAGETSVQEAQPGPSPQPSPPPGLPPPPDLVMSPIVPPGTPLDGLLAGFTPLPPPRSLMPDVTSRIDLPGIGPSPFGRLIPFGDGREIIVRRGPVMGRHHGMEMRRRLVQIGGHEFLVVTFMDILSPPVLRPGEQPMSAEAAQSYKPISDILFLPDAEVYLPRDPSGFSDAEFERILSAITVSPPTSPAAAPPAGSTVDALSPERALELLRARTATSYELKAAICIVSSARPPAAVALLRGYLRDTDLTVVEATCNALACLGAKEATSDLLDLLRPAAEAERNIDCGGDPFGWYEAPPRASALAALTTLRVTEAERGARALLGDPDEEVRSVARQYFTTLGLPLDEFNAEGSSSSRSASS